MQTHLHLYTLLLLTYLLFFHSIREVRSSKLLQVILLLILYTTAINVYAIYYSPLSDVLLISAYTAQALYIPAVYIYFRNLYYQEEVNKPDFLHLAPFFLLGLDLFVGNFLLGKGTTLSLLNLFRLDESHLQLRGAFPPIFIIYGCTAFYTSLIILMIKPRVRELLKTTEKSKEHLTVIRSKQALAIEAKNPYAVAGISEEKSIQMNAAIKEVLESKKPFLQQRYSLKELAIDTQIPLHHLSAFINHYCQMNFNDFINEYRVQYSQEKMRNHECTYKKLETIAKESGFNNRNTFTAAFKKVTGQTPSQFLKQVNAGQSEYDSYEELKICS